jgi:hypothetical protein
MKEKPTRVLRIDSDSIQPLKHDQLFGDIVIDFQVNTLPFSLVIEEEMALVLAGAIILKLQAAQDEAAMWDYDTEYQDTF